MSHYNSDDSTVVNDEHTRRRRRRSSHHSASEHPHRGRRFSHDKRPRPRHRSPSPSTYGTLRKVVIAAGVIQLIGGLIHLWNNEKNAEKERMYQRQKKRAFERAKEIRRREEEMWERERDSEDEYSPVPEVRRIEYAPAIPRSRSTSRAPRRIEPPPPRSGRSSRRSSVRSSRRRSRSSSVDGRGYESVSRGTSRLR